MKKKPIDIKLFEGVIVPGETYLLLSEAHSHSDAGPIEDLFTIRTTEDIVAAIEGVDLIISERFEYKELLEVRKYDNDCCALRLWCHDKKRKRKQNRPFYLFLHRIPGAGEMLNQVKENCDSAIVQDEPVHPDCEGKEDIE
jgi:hypothetical protein